MTSAEVIVGYEDHTWESIWVGFDPDNVDNLHDEELCAREVAEEVLNQMGKNDYEFLLVRNIYDEGEDIPDANE